MFLFKFSYVNLLKKSCELITKNQRKKFTFGSENMKYKITSRFGDFESFRNSPHTGLDLKMNTGEPLRAIESGIVHIKDYGNRISGKTVILETENGTQLYYGHLSKFHVEEGQHVEIGQLIGEAGNTGFSTGSHLHFAVREGGTWINPSSYIEKIQNMNNPKFIAQLKSDIVQQSYSWGDMFKDYSSMYSDFFSSLKLNLIHLINSVDYTMFIQYIQNLFQFFS